MITECCFCEEHLRPLNSQYYIELGKKIGVNSRILVETNNWYAVPSLGCLTIGYILLVCKQHYQSAANLSAELYQEMLELKDLVEKTIYERLGLKCLAFEHGTTSPRYSGANSVDHIHLHIVPFTQEIWPDISRKYGIDNFDIITDYKDLFSLWTNTCPKTYLLFQDLNKVIYYKPDAHEFPSQFFRKCLAPYFKAEKWDWRQEYYQENFIKTMDLFR